jgi:hypothetical protein
MHTETQSSAQRISVNILHGSDYTANIHVDGRLVLKLLIWNVRVQTGFIWLNFMST